MSCAICGIDDATSGSIILTKCDHTFHNNCLDEWRRYSPGDFIAPLKNCCPICREQLEVFPIFSSDGHLRFTHEELSKYKTKIFSYRICSKCNEVFEVGSITCAAQEHADLTSAECEKCEVKGVLGRQQIICPGCGNELLHLNGCRNFKCCLFGYEGCRGFGCKHGSNNLIKFCGYTWCILESQVDHRATTNIDRQYERAEFDHDSDDDYLDRHIILNYYDRNGYNVQGFNDRGYDRNGYDVYGFDDQGYNREGFDRDGFNRNGYNARGFDRLGRDHDGYDTRGYRLDGFDRNGYSRYGYHRSEYDQDGRDPEGFNMTGYGRDGFNRRGFNYDGYDREGYNTSGFTKDGYNRQGVDALGRTRDGFNKYGYSKYGYTFSQYIDGYDPEGYDVTGYDREGYTKYGHDRDGYDREGYNSFGYNRNGYDSSGFDGTGRDRNGIRRH